MHLPNYDAWKMGDYDRAPAYETDRRELSNKVVTARKPHRCDDCAREIKPGRNYTRIAYVEEGGAFNTETICLPCDHRRDEEDPRAPAT